VCCNECDRLREEIKALRWHLSEITGGPMPEEASPPVPGLSPQETRVYLALRKVAPRVVTFDGLRSVLAWDHPRDYDVYTEDRHIRTLVWGVRYRLREAGRPERVINVRHVGYALNL
jgi:hypothetical protein